MKKIIYFTLIALFIMTGASFAWTVDSTGSSGPSIDAKASKNVVIVVNSGTGQSYAASAGHKSGDKAYGVASDSSLVMYKTKTKGVAWANNSQGSNADAFSSWTSM